MRGIHCNVSFAVKSFLMASFSVLFDHTTHTHKHSLRCHHPGRPHQSQPFSAMCPGLPLPAAALKASFLRVFTALSLLPHALNQLRPFPFIVILTLRKGRKSHSARCRKSDGQRLSAELLQAVFLPMSLSTPAAVSAHTSQTLGMRALRTASESGRNDEMSVFEDTESSERDKW